LDYNIKNQIGFIKRKKDVTMIFLKKIILLFVTTIVSIDIFAQQNDVKMADTMRSNGRIYVVVAVVLTILIGLILYIVRLDRNIRKLEKEN
jgi:hypothetical protein